MTDPHSSSPDFSSFLSARYLAWSVGLSLLGIGLVTWFTWTPGILASISPKRLPGLAIAVAVTLLRTLFSALRIRQLAENRISFAGALRVSLTWDFSSGIMPSWVGGAPMAAIALTRERMKIGEASAIMLFATLLDQLFFALAIPSMLLLSIGWKVFPPGMGHAGTIAAITVFAFILAYAMLLAYGVLFDPSAIKRLAARLGRFAWMRRRQPALEKLAADLEQGFLDIRSKPRGFLRRSYLFTFMMWLCRIALPAIVVLSFMPARVDLSFLRSMAMNIGGLVLPTPGGAGGMEGLFALFLGPLMIRPGFLGICIFLWRFISYYISIGCGLAVVLWYLRAVSKPVKMP